MHSRSFKKTARHCCSGTNYKQGSEQCYRFDLVAKRNLPSRLYISGWHHRRHHKIIRTPLIISFHCGPNRCRCLQNRRRLDLVGFESTIQRITCIAPDRMGSRLAVGHGSGVSILVSDSGGELHGLDVIRIVTLLLESWTVTKQFPFPGSFRDSACGTVEIVGIHWLEPKGDCLVVVYCSHSAQYVCYLSSCVNHDD